MPSHYDIDCSHYDKANIIAHLVVFGVGVLLIVLICTCPTKNKTDNTDSTAIADTVRKSIGDTITIKQR
mgnify:CR=1 FL=1